MEYRRLGHTGLKVPLLGLGGNTFGKHFQFGKYNDEAASIALIHYAAELGINQIDTGDLYSAGLSETYIGKAIAGRRADYVIASKVGQAVGAGPNDTGLSRRHIMASIEGSLKRLNTDYVDIYYAHKPDPHTPIAETLCAFDDIVRQGKARYVACSNYAGWQVAQASELARRHHWAPFTVSQSPYNLLEREIEAELIPACVEYGMGIVAYWPLAQGVLAGRYRPGEPIPPGTRAWQNDSRLLARQMAKRNLYIAARLGEWAAQHGHQLSELALAWVAAKPHIACIVTGVTSAEQLKLNVEALEWTLSAGQVAEVEAIVTEGREAES